ncbi:MAG: hypothetical protein JXR52_08650 [Bacteroidales bacterium]|nr:hypothetical protein [Bacteroidales bacterium]MBN2698881.1 hypothetical protein [Bacteroidales bacterium]
MKKQDRLPVKREPFTPSAEVKNTHKSAPELKHRFKSIFTDGIRSVGVSDDDKFLVITFEGAQGWIKVLDLDRLEFMPHDYSSHTESVRLTSISKDCRTVYTASWDCTFRRFDILNGSFDWILRGYGRSPSCFLDPREKLLFTASYDQDFDLSARNNGRCWDIATGEEINVYRHLNNRKGTECIDIACDGKSVYTASDDGYTYRFMLNGEQPDLEYFHFEGAVRKLSISSRYICTACTDGFIRIHDKNSGNLHRYLFHSEAEVRDVKIASDETRVYSASEDGSVKCFDLVTGKEIFYTQVHSSWIWSICLCQEDKVLVTGSSDGSAAFISTGNGRILARLQNIQSDGNLLISCESDESFPSGFFYTNNPDDVFVFSKSYNTPMNLLRKDDPERLHYIQKHNLKNLVLARIRNNGSYADLTGRYRDLKNFITRGTAERLPLMLRE